MHLLDWLLLAAICSCPVPLLFFLTLEIFRPDNGKPAGDHTDAA